MWTRSLPRHDEEEIGHRNFFEMTRPGSYAQELTDDGSQFMASFCPDNFDLPNLYLTGADHRYVRLKPHWCKLFGLSERDYPGLKFPKSV